MFQPFLRFNHDAKIRVGHIEMGTFQPFLRFNLYADIHAPLILLKRFVSTLLEIQPLHIAAYHGEVVIAFQPFLRFNCS